MWDTAGKIIEYGIIGVLVVVSVGILIFSLKHVSKILSKIEGVHVFYNNIVTKQNSDQKVEIKDLHKEHKTELQKLHKEHLRKTENITEQFMGSLEVIHVDHMKDHVETLAGQKRIEALINGNSTLFGSSMDQKKPH